MASHLIAPSILTADFLNLGDQIEMVNHSEADFLHLDIMDGLFVTNLTFGFPIIKQIKSKSVKPLDVHLMIVDPDRHLENFRDAGADMITVHFEACQDIISTIARITDLGMKPSVSIKPETDISVVEPYLEKLYI